MNIQYEPTKDDTRAAIDHSWSRLPAFRRRTRLVGAAVAFMVLSLGYTASRSVNPIVIMLAVTTFVAFPWIFRAVLVSATKRGIRTLSIDRDGITTEIGRWSGSVPWRDVLRIDDSGSHIFVIGKSLNSFSIPHRAFPDTAGRELFVERLKRYLAEQPN